eukprot:3933459-Rhodomonas_salina.1
MSVVRCYAVRGTELRYGATSGGRVLAGQFPMGLRVGRYTSGTESGAAYLPTLSSYAILLRYRPTHAFCTLTSCVLSYSYTLCATRLVPACGTNRSPGWIVALFQLNRGLFQHVLRVKGDNVPEYARVGYNEAREKAGLPTDNNDVR